MCLRPDLAVPRKAPNHSSYGTETQGSTVPTLKCTRRSAMSARTVAAAELDMGERMETRGDKETRL